MIPFPLKLIVLLIMKFNHYMMVLTSWSRLCHMLILMIFAIIISAKLGSIPINHNDYYGKEKHLKIMFSCLVDVTPTQILGSIRSPCLW